MKSFEEWRGAFAGCDCVVFAPGPSLHNRPPVSLDARWTIGCNRAVEEHMPDFGLCIEPFVDPIWKTIRNRPPLVVFSHLCEDRHGRQPFPRIVKFPSKNLRDWFDPGSSEPELWYGMSPLWAAGVAAWLGFARVGLLGVDLTDPDRWTPGDVERINRVWAELLKITPGTRFLNLSPTSLLSAVPAGEWWDIGFRFEQG